MAVLIAVGAAVAILVFILVTVLVLVWLERKVSARMQVRWGPMRVGGRHGPLQTVADTIKLVLKEDIRPEKADKWVFILGPGVAMVPAILVWVTVPFSSKWVAQNLNIGIFYMVAVSSLCVLGIIMGGWAPNNKYTMLGGLRSAAQMVSYEIPLMMVVVAMVLIAGTMDMQGIVEGQRKFYGLHWNLFTNPVAPFAFLIYVAAACAETNRVPFDLPEAESELVSGFHTEYTGIKFAFFFLAEYANLFAASAVAATLFLGGWAGPGPDYLAPIWFFAKCYLMIFLFMWIRWTLPRVRVDQLTAVAWKVLFPASLICIVLAAGWVTVR